MKLYCGECKLETVEDCVDFGIGPYEFWGQKCVNSNKQWVSKCCEETLYLDPECTVEYEHEDWGPEERERLPEDEEYEIEFHRGLY